MTSQEFVKKAIDIATNYKTLYVMGCFGSPMNDKNKTRYTTNNDYNKQTARTSKIKAASSNTFGFDCVCLIKGILWGWNGDLSKTYGGATYKSNGVADVGADKMATDTYCTDLSTDFSNIIAGEVVWMDGHIGIYIGNGLVVEATPIWKDGVQITALKGTNPGYIARTWTKHGKLKYIEYPKQPNYLEEIELLKTEIETLKKSIIEKDDKISLLNRECDVLNMEIAELNREIDGLSKYKFKYISKKDGYVRIKMYKDELLLIKD